jgi:hypothetical protein
MPSDVAALLGIVILAFPMVCFFLSSPTFLLVGLEVPEVTQLLRGIIRGYFLAISIAGTISMGLLVVAGRPAIAAAAIAIAVFSVLVRRTLLHRMDSQLQARDAGVADAVRQLRVLHIQCMLINAIQLAIVLAAVPVIV